MLYKYLQTKFKINLINQNWKLFWLAYIKNLPKVVFSHKCIAANKRASPQWDCIILQDFQVNRSRHHCNLEAHPKKSKRGSNLLLGGMLSQRIKQRNSCKVSLLPHCYRLVIASSWHFSAHRSHATYRNSPEIIHLFRQISCMQKLSVIFTDKKQPGLLPLGLLYLGS